MKYMLALAIELNQQEQEVVMYWLQGRYTCFIPVTSIRQDTKYRLHGLVCCGEPKMDICDTLVLTLAFSLQVIGF